MNEMVCLFRVGKQRILIGLLRKYAFFICFDYHLYLLENSRLSTSVEMGELIYSVYLSIAIK